jgi:hypothetical protein
MRNILKNNIYVFFNKNETRKKIIYGIKESIQPQVPLRLPCYNFTSIKEPTFVSYIKPPITPIDHTQ